MAGSDITPGSAPVMLQLTPGLSAGLAFASSQMKSGALSVFDTQLGALYLQSDSAARQGFDTSAFQAMAPTATNSMAMVDGREYVTIDVVAKSGDAASLLPALEAAGLTDAAAFKGVASGEIAVDQLGALRDLLAGSGGSAGEIGYARASGFMTNTGSVDTQADQAEHADVARSSYGVDGTGITVGVLSDSFDTATKASTHMADDIATGDLPSSVNILEDFAGGTDEGRAMAQLVHDIAPGAAIDFATAEGGEAHFAQNILALAAAGATVIVDDVLYYEELAYQEGPIAQAIDQVAAQGVSYFSSAGNDASGSKATGYEGAWVAGATYTGGGETTTLMNFAPGQDYIPVTLANQETLVLQWANPGASAGGPGATADLDLFVTNQDGSVVRFFSETNNIGGDPVESLSLTGGAGQTYYVRVGLVSGPAPSEIKLMALADGGSVSFTSPSSNTNIGTFYGHAAAAGAIAVGAASFLSTPQFGVNPPAAEGYSSGGPDKFLFDPSGNVLATPINRIPTFTAVDGGNTTFFGHDIAGDADSLPNFFGTSAAAPDAAAVAALILQARSGLSPAEISTLLQDSSTDMATPGIDNRTGTGLINANLAVGYAQTLNITSSQAVITGTHLSDVITATGAASVSGGDGDDTLIGSTGNDTLDGGAGTNTASYASANAAVTVSLALTGVQTTGGGGHDLLVNIQNLTGSPFNDTLQGTTGDNVLDGAGGVNTVSYSNAPAGVTVDLSLSGPQDTAGAGHDALANFQNVTGSAFNDTIAGNAGDNVLDGGAGIDTLTYADAGAGVTISLALTTAQATGGSGNDTVKNFENLTGSAYDDVLTGNTAANVLTGGAGNDTLEGGTGNDTLDGGDGVDSASYAHSTGAVNVDLALTAIQNTGPAGHDLLTNIEGLIGSAFNDTLQGDAGDNALDGGGGVNTVSYSLAPAGVAVDLSLSGPQDTVGDGHDSLVNFQNLIGSPFNDTLSGNAGNNSLDGGTGVDTLSYADATAGVTVSLALTTAQATGGAGTDTIKNFENLTGSGFNDTLTGNTSANTIMGGAGDDRITGGGKADILWGGPGADTFVYASVTDSSVGTSGQDQIMDFSHAEGDRIDLSAIDPSFTLISSFDHHPDELIQIAKPGGWLVEGDVNGDGKADFAVFVHATDPLVAGDFIL